MISDNVPGWYAVDERPPEPHPGALEPGDGPDEGPDEEDIEASEALEDRDEDVAEAG